MPTPAPTTDPAPVTPLAPVARVAFVATQADVAVMDEVIALGKAGVVLSGNEVTALLALRARMAGE